MVAVLIRLSLDEDPSIWRYSKDGEAGSPVGVVVDGAICVWSIGSSDVSNIEILIPSSQDPRC